MDIIIPIYNPSEHRITNLEFILNELTDISANVHVFEQLSDNKCVSNLLKKHKDINYFVFDIDNNTFNKSILINKSVEKINSDLIWILDADVFLNYKYVINNIPQNIEFMRPFDKIITLNEEETITLKQTNKIKLSSREYNTYSGYGKYSFIIQKKLFNQIGGFNENFKGWGFQDLDFIKKIPVNCYKGHTDNIGFHLFHDKQSREYYKDNKNLFNNLNERRTSRKSNTTLKTEDEKSEEEYYEDEKEEQRPIKRVMPPRPILASEQTNIVNKTQPNWPRPQMIFIHRDQTGSSIYNKTKHWNNIFFYNATQPTSVTRTLRGISKSNYLYEHKLICFLQFLIKIFDEIKPNTSIVYIIDTNKSDVARNRYDLLKKLNRGLYYKNINMGITRFDTGYDFILKSSVILKFGFKKIKKLLIMSQKKSNSEKNEILLNLTNYFLEFE